MKHFKFIFKGIGKSIFIFLAIALMPIWFPIAMLHDMGCTDPNDEWLDSQGRYL